MLYAPIGLLSKSADVLPELAERGRARAANARVIGQFALGATNTKAREAISEAEQHISTFLKIVADSSSPKRSATKNPQSSTEAAPGAGEQNSVAVEDLISGYDDLTAAQILPLLKPLSSEGRDRIEAYERATRSRKTILNRLRQLNG